MSPEKYAEAGTEHSYQVALFMKVSKYLDKYPELKWLYAIPNGGERNVAVAGRLKAEGVKAGVSDLCLPVAKCGHHGMYIEMKKLGGKESDKQKEFGAFLKEQGYFYTCCDHWEKAWQVIVWYMGILENDQT